MKTELSKHAREHALSVWREIRPKLETCNRSDLEAPAMVLIQAREFDGADKRVYDATAHLYFMDAAESMITKIKSGK